ncbi:Glycyl-tRNA synthetase beta chain [hydrothermal vent metagenome]|uniref:glycine--tRNA ligase n=1 Tax=hydrothermal vent metagenome TaxID=652676 RepID=A0A3B1D7L7_9ZZZZ
MGELLFEIGVEEIPAGYIKPAEEALDDNIYDELNELGLHFKNVTTYSTPRRLAVSVTGLPDRRPTKVTKKYGPPKKAAFTKDGEPTKAAIGFASGMSVDVSAIKVEQTKKGEYIYVEVTEGGEETADLLVNILPDLALDLPFPKSMKWGDGAIQFTRPIHWIVALFDGKTLPLAIGDIESSDVTRGHRFLGSQSIKVTGSGDYVSKLKENFVIADSDERKAIVLEGTRAVAEKHGVRLLEDDELIETVSFLTEWPVPMYGSFEEEYLALPDELLIASMKGHQKMFCVKNDDGKLTNGFVGVSNMIVNDKNVVVNGYKRVLKARLADAKFFFDEDRKHSLEHFASKLDGVVYQKKLGTVGEKVSRIVKLAEYLAEKIDPEKKQYASRAAALCKADLETLMVYEFPELQGIMGREYSRHEGEPDEVCAAIYESYLPRFAGDDLPTTETGAIVSLAEKVDTIVGCFGVGLIPTGTQDPFALRRQTLGVIQIVFDKGYVLSLNELLTAAIGSFGGKLESSAAELKTKIEEFFAGRLKNMWTSNGVPYDVADSVLAAGFDDLADANKRVAAMAELKKREFFEPLAVTFKRVANITKGHIQGAVDEALFEKETERRLHDEVKKAAHEVAPKLAAGDYLDSLERVAALRGMVDTFFDDVLVMADDEAVKNNRLNLLSNISMLFLKIADFSKIVA